MIRCVYMTLSIESLPKRVRRFREEANLSQEGLAALVVRETGDGSYHQTAISAIERGTSNPSIQVLAAFARIFETNTDYLLGLTDDSRPPTNEDEQMIIGVRDAGARRVLQELVDLLLAAEPGDQQIILDVTRRIVGAPNPRIIGG